MALYKPLFLDDANTIAGLRRGMKTIPAHRRIFREGESASEVYTVRSGWAFRYRELSHGRRQIFSFIIPGDSIPLVLVWMTNSPLPFSIKSLTEMSLCVFPLPEFRELMRTTPEQTQELEAFAYQITDAAYDRMADLGRRSARGRIAQLLRHLQSRLRSRGLADTASFHFPLRQEHIADATGLTPVHVNRTLGLLKKEGIVSIEGQQLTVLDEEALIATSEEF